MSRVDRYSVPFGVLPQNRDELMQATDSLMTSFVSELSAVAASLEGGEVTTTDVREPFRKTVEAAERLRSRVYSPIHKFTFLFSEMAKSAKALQMSEQEYGEIFKQKELTVKTRVRASLTKIRKFASNKLFELDEIPVPFGMETRRETSRKRLEDLIRLNAMKIFRALRGGNFG